MKRLLLFVALAYALGTCASFAQAPSPYLVLEGEVTSPQHFTEADFRKLPRTTVTGTDSSGMTHIFDGVALSHLLTLGGVPLRGNLKGADVAKFLHTQGRDGFVAIFALPEFDTHDFLVADTVDGKPLEPSAGPLQIISPAETRRSRWVKQLTTLRINRSQ